MGAHGISAAEARLHAHSSRRRGETPRDSRVDDGWDRLTLPASEFKLMASGGIRTWWSTGRYVLPSCLRPVIDWRCCSFGRRPGLMTRKIKMGGGTRTVKRTRGPRPVQLALRTYLVLRTGGTEAAVWLDRSWKGMCFALLCSALLRFALLACSML